MTITILLLGFWNDTPLPFHRQLVFRMHFAVCNSRMNSQLHSRMQFAIQNILQCVCIPKGLKQSGWGSGDKLPPM